MNLHNISKRVICTGILRVKLRVCLLLTLLFALYRSRIHERTNSLRFMGIIWRVLRLEVSVYNVYITNQFQATAQGGGGDP
jgi:hypothetical protein